MRRAVSTASEPELLKKMCENGSPRSWATFAASRTVGGAAVLKKVL
jgi:hypothetical protein